MKKSWILASLLAAGLATQGAQAATILWFDLTTASSALGNNCGVGSGQGCLENGDQVTASGVDGTVTLTFSAVDPASTSSFIRVDPQGIFFDDCFSQGTCTSQQDAAGSFGISFSRDVSIQLYSIGYVSPGTVPVTGGFRIFANSDFSDPISLVSSLGTAPGVGTWNFINPSYTFSANTVYYVKGNTTDLAQLSSIGVFIEDVPEPGTLALLGLGLAGLGLSRRRKAA